MKTLTRAQKRNTYKEIKYRVRGAQLKHMRCSKIRKYHRFSYCFTFSYNTSELNIKPSVPLEGNHERYTKKFPCTLYI